MVRVDSYWRELKERLSPHAGLQENPGDLKEEGVQSGVTRERGTGQPPILGGRIRLIAGVYSLSSYFLHPGIDPPANGLTDTANRLPLFRLTPDEGCRVGKAPVKTVCHTGENRTALSARLIADGYNVRKHTA